VDATIVLTRDGAEREVTLTVGALEPVHVADAAPARDEDGAAAKIGVTLAPLTAEARRDLGLGEDFAGALVVDVDADGPAARAGLRAGDVILRIGDTTVESVSGAIAALDQTKGGSVLARIARGDARLFVGVPLA
jgi:serine protease Do